MPFEMVSEVFVQTLSDCYGPVYQCCALSPPVRCYISSEVMHCSYDCNRALSAISGIMTYSMKACSKLVTNLFEVTLDTAYTTG